MAELDEAVNGDTTGELRPPEVARSDPRPVRRPMSAGLDTDRYLPSVFGSVRFRLALLYSVLLFGLAAVVVGGLYAGLSRELGRTILEEVGIDYDISGAELRGLTDDGEISVNTLEEF